MSRGYRIAAPLGLFAFYRRTLARVFKKIQKVRHIAPRRPLRAFPLPGFAALLVETEDDPCPDT